MPTSKRLAPDGEPIEPEHSHRWIQLSLVVTWRPTAAQPEPPSSGVAPVAAAMPSARSNTDSVNPPPTTAPPVTSSATSHCRSRRKVRGTTQR